MLSGVLEDGCPVDDLHPLLVRSVGAEGTPLFLPTSPLPAVLHSSLGE